eukprot:453275-Rhodomonas_salina.1
MMLAENGNWEECLKLVRSATRSTLQPANPSEGSDLDSGYQEQSSEEQRTHDLLMEIDPSSGETIMHLAVRAASEAQTTAEKYPISVIFVLEETRKDVDQMAWKANMVDFLCAYAGGSTTGLVKAEQVGVEFRSFRSQEERRLAGNFDDSDDSDDYKECMVLRIEQYDPSWEEDRVQQALAMHPKSFLKASKRSLDVKVLNGVSEW